MTLDVMIQMEYCSEDTLADYMEQRNYEANRKVIFKIFKQIMSGLKHIHSKGLIHRDIKPANIFFDPKS